MGLTISLTQLKRKKKKDGTIPIYIRFTEDRKSRYRSTGIAVKKSEWNSNKKKVSLSKKRETEQIQKNIELEKQLDEIKSIKRDLYKRDALSMAAILNELSTDTDTRSILHQATEYRKTLNNSDKYWQHRHFGVIINNLDGFISKNGHSDRLDKLDSDWIEDFQTFLLNDVGNINNTVRKKIQRFKRLIKWLIKNGEIEDNPFTKAEIVKREKTDTKVKLSFQQIEAIKSLDLKKGSDLWHTRNYFMYSFYNAGIRFGDVCCLTWDNIVDGRLVYKMNKTGNDKSIQQMEPMYWLLFQYVDDLGKYISLSEWQPVDGFYLQKATNAIDDIIETVVNAYSNTHRKEYIFPILKKQYSDHNQLRKKISSKNVIVNRHLKTIATKAGVQASLSFHVSRHSFAHYALKKGMDLYAISKALGHSGLKITEEYIKSFDEELLDKSMNKLF